jgi:hypothetical protein
MSEFAVVVPVIWNGKQNVSVRRFCGGIVLRQQTHGFTHAPHAGVPLG